MITRHPGLAFAYAHPAHFVALGFGAGVSRFAPGTMGTVLAFPLWWLIAPGYSSLEILAILVLLFGIGVWACELTGAHLGMQDHGAMCWDEVVAFLAVLAVVPDDAGWQLAAFFVFRAFDVVKPSPIREFERRVKGGLGVMLDDLLAAGYTLLVLAIAKRILA